MKETVETLQKYLKQNQTLVVATSGGPDSMVLLDIINKQKEKYNLKIVCAHINHGLRQESIEEEKMVKKYCQKNNIICKNMTITNYKTNSIENEAREKRYRFFEKCVNNCQADYLLTAHHGDDQIETILMRIVRGSHLKGYAGINEISKKNNYQILRPMLNNTKQEILNYAKANKIPYAIDKTNMEDTYTRNRYRKYILPKLKEENKNVHKKFQKFNQTINMYQNYIDKIVKEKIKEITIDDKISINKLKQEDIIIQINIIMTVLKQIYKNNITKITDKHTRAILKMLSSKKNITINLPDNIIAIKSYNYLTIQKKNQVNTYKLKLTNKMSLPNNHKIEIVNIAQDNSNYTCLLNTKELSLPLYIRNKRKGDKVAVKGLNGHKKIKDIFIDEKIPPEERKTYPILVDNNNQILWIPGLKKTKFNKQKTEKYDIIIKYH